MIAQFTLLTLASSKRMVYLMALTPAAAVIAAEYAAVCLERLRELSATHGRARWLHQHRRGVLGGLLAVIVVAYLAAALWVIPRGDRHASFLPLTERIRSLQAEGDEVKLFTPSERLAGAGVFYSRSLLPAVNEEGALRAFLEASPRHIAVMERREAPPAPFVVVDRFDIEGREYYFVSY